MAVHLKIRFLYALHIVITVHRNYSEKKIILQHIVNGFLQKVDMINYKVGNLVANTKDFSNIIAKIEGQ